MAVPLLMSGPDLPSGRVADDIVSLVDCYPTSLEGLGVEPTEEERRLPGESFWRCGSTPPVDRAAFSEYHAVASKSGSYMLRAGRFKYVHYVGYEPQLFDLESDPLETSDLAKTGTHQDVLAKMEARLREVVDPEEADARAKSDQQTLVQQHGGKEAVLRRGTFVNSPVPGEQPKFTGK